MNNDEQGDRLYRFVEYSSFDTSNISLIIDAVESKLMYQSTNNIDLRKYVRDKSDNSDCFQTIIQYNYNKMYVYTM